MIRRFSIHAGRAACALALAGLAAGAPRSAAAQDIPKHPDQFQYPPLRYEPPRASAHRVKLKSGAVAYLVPDRSIPLVTVTALLRVGPDLDPAGKEGLAALAMHLITRSGTATKTAQQVEDRVAFLGAQLASGLGGGGGNPLSFGPPIGPTEASVSINLLAKDVDEGLALLVECLKSPAWEAERVKLQQEQTRANLEKRNDDSAPIEEREWSHLMRGDAHWSNRHVTEASNAAIGVADLAAFHQRWVGPKNFVLAVSGDFDRAAMVKKLDQAFARWPYEAEKPAAPPAPTASAATGWFMVDKDVNQGRVSIGLRALDRYDPDYQAARVMNDVLGGGSFSSRLVNRIRSDEGLAYSVRSAFEGGVWYPDPWRITFQSKVRSVPYAIEVALAEVAKFRDEGITAEELTLAQNKFIEGLPTAFESAGAIAGVLAVEELTGRYARDPNYYAEVRDRIRAVTAADVQRVAKRLLDPAKLTVLLVGDVDEMLLGDPKHAAKLGTLANGEPRRLPMRDPLTMKPMPNP